MIIPLRLKRIVAEVLQVEVYEVNADTYIGETSDNSIIFDIIAQADEAFGVECSGIDNFLNHFSEIKTVADYWSLIQDAVEEKSSEEQVAIVEANKALHCNAYEEALSLYADAIAGKQDSWKVNWANSILERQNDLTSFILMSNAADMVLLEASNVLNFIVFCPIAKKYDQALHYGQKMTPYFISVTRFIENNFSDYPISDVLFTIVLDDKYGFQKEDFKDFEDEPLRYELLSSAVFERKDLTLSEQQVEMYNAVCNTLDNALAFPPLDMPDHSFDFMTLADPDFVKFLEKGKDLAAKLDDDEAVMGLSLHTVLLGDNADRQMPYVIKLKDELFPEMKANIEVVDFTSTTQKSNLESNLKYSGKVIWVKNLNLKSNSSLNVDPYDELVKLFIDIVKDDNKNLYVLSMSALEWQKMEARFPMLRVHFQYIFQSQPIEDHHLFEEFKGKLAQRAYTLTEEAESLSREYLGYMLNTLPPEELDLSLTDAFAKEVLFYHYVSPQANEDTISRQVIFEAIKDEYSLSESKPLSVAMVELEKLTGLKQVKQNIKSLAAMIDLSVKRQQKGKNVSLNSLFVGNPGTGKTTVANLLGEIYKSIGVLSRGHVVTATRSQIVEKWIGHTARNMKSLIDSARGGILLIDEAYALYKDDDERDFGKEAIDTLVAELENIKEHTCVILAGYPEPMERFLNVNPGLASRFPHKIHFEDYNGDELYDILFRFIRSEHYILADDSTDKLKQFLKQLWQNRTSTFGNARECRNLFEQLKLIHAERVIGIEDATEEVLNTFSGEDVEALMAGYVVAKSDRRVRIGF